MKSKNAFEGKGRGISYFRFPVAWSYWVQAWNTSTPKGVFRFFNPLFQWIEHATDHGKNVLIHCLAGAHRAGTTGVSWLMYAEDLKYRKALKKAKKLRPAINPIGSFPKLLKKLEDAL